jgi:hypothetical protein
LSARRNAREFGKPGRSDAVRHLRAGKDEFRGDSSGLLVRRSLLRHRRGPGTWDSSGSVGLLCCRRPERELAETVQSLGVAESVAAVTEQGQGLLVAGGNRG